MTSQQWVPICRLVAFRILRGGGEPLQGCLPTCSRIANEKKAASTRPAVTRTYFFTFRFSLYSVSGVSNNNQVFRVWSVKTTRVPTTNHLYRHPLGSSSSSSPSTSSSSGPRPELQRETPVLVQWVVPKKLSKRPRVFISLILIHLIYPKCLRTRQAPRARG